MSEVRLLELESVYSCFPELRGRVDEEVSALSEYLESVTHLAKGGLNLEFNNKGRFHAAIVMSTIFKHARKDIKIFAKDYSGQICDSQLYRDAIEEAINRNIQVKVVFESKPNENSLCLKMLRQCMKAGKNVEIKLLTPDFLNKHLRPKSQSERLSNFTVSDSTMFRYETDKETYKAFCNFDDRELSSLLDHNFNVLLTESKPV